MNNFKYRNQNKLLTGLIILLAGVGLLAKKAGFSVPDWLFSWPMILIIIGLWGAIRQGFRCTSWIILLIIGMAFLIDEYIKDFPLRPYLLPIAIIILGIWIILKKPRRTRHDFRFLRSWKNKEYNKSWNYCQSTQDSADSIQISSIFSGIKKIILSKNFQGGKITCIFGGVELDFMKSDMNGTQVIEIDEVMGGIKLKVPQNWEIQTEIDGVFHGIDDKRNFMPGNNDNRNNKKMLILRGNAVMSGIEISSY